MKIWSHSVKSLSFLPVYLIGWSGAVLSMMPPSSARAVSFAAILAVSARSCSAIWAQAAASVTWACCSVAPRSVSLEVPVSSVLPLAPRLLFLDCTLLWLFHCAACHCALPFLPLPLFHRIPELDSTLSHQLASSRSWNSEHPLLSSTMRRYHDDVSSCTRVLCLSHSTCCEKSIRQMCMSR